MLGKLKNTAVIIIGIAMLLLMGYAAIPHHHHYHNNKAFLNLCSQHVPEAQHCDPCKINSENEHTENHLCLQCRVDRGWQVNSFHSFNVSAYLPEFNTILFIQAENIAVDALSKSLLIPEVSGVQYRGPPQRS